MNKHNITVKAANKNKQQQIHSNKYVNQQAYKANIYMYLPKLIVESHIEYINKNQGNFKIKHPIFKKTRRDTHKNTHTYIHTQISTHVCV